MRGTRSISVFFPAFNDEGTIAEMVAEAPTVLPTLIDDYEVLVVNDGSTDGTTSVLDELVRPHARAGHPSHAQSRLWGGAGQRLAPC